MTWLQTNDAQQIQARLLNLERHDGATYLTLTRTTNQNITTAGTTVVWQQAIENVGEWSWGSGSAIIPVAGYYQVTIMGQFALKDGVTGEISVNSVIVATMGTGDGKDTLFRLNSTRFFKQGDLVRIVLTMATGTHSLQVVTEDSAGESPILHMVLI